MNIGLVLTELGRYGEALEAGQYAARAYKCARAPASGWRRWR